MPKPDERYRAEAFRILDRIVDAGGPYFTRSHLRNIPLDVSTPHLVDLQKGIWNPWWLEATLSVLTMPEHSYDDREIAEGVWAYSYRAGGSQGDNIKLQRACDLEVDVIYFRPASRLTYEPIYPVRVVANYPDRGEVVLVRRDVDRVDWSRGEDAEPIYLREWSERVVLARKHQADFRKRVMKAYSSRCAMCGFHHESLLDAAHIDSDKSEYGEPHVNNGLALCRIHHGAFDKHLMTVTPDRMIEVAARVLRENDGPILQYGIQALHGQPLRDPARDEDYPLRGRLDRRYELFKAAESRALTP